MLISSLARFTIVGKWFMRSLPIVIIHRIDCRKNNFAGKTATNPSHIYSLMIVVDIRERVRKYSLKCENGVTYITAQLRKQDMRHLLCIIIECKGKGSLLRQRF